jgi:hypothetical protein
MNDESFQTKNQLHSDQSHPELDEPTPLLSSYYFKILTLSSHLHLGSLNGPFPSGSLHYCLHTHTHTHTLPASPEFDPGPGNRDR